MLQYTPVIRKQDGLGAGHWHAPRGTRLHKGIDYAIGIMPGIDGIVTKWGYVYKNNFVQRYIEITDSKKYRHRYFYIIASVKVGQSVKRDDIIGTVQEIGSLYPKITPHVHVGIYNPEGVKINPEEYYGHE